MDVFFEQIVAKKNTPIDTLKKVGIIIAALILIFAFMIILPGFFPVMGTFGLLLAAGVCYGSWYLLTNMSVEYEYILTNGEIDVDKIVARRKRKRLITVNTRAFTEFGLYRAEEHANRNYQSRVIACSSETDPNTYYAVTDHPKFGNCLLVFNPNEKILQHAKEFIRKNVIK